MKAVSQPLPKLTRKQQGVLKLLYSHRFLNRIQLQTFLKHKDYKRINVWLQYLRANNYVQWVYSTDFAEKTKPAIYYLAINGIRYLRSTTVMDENGKALLYPIEELRKRYREAERSRSYIDRCLLVADCVLTLEQARTDKIWYYYETEADYRQELYDYHFLADSELIQPQLVFGKIKDEPGSNIDPGADPTYLLECFDSNLPRYRMHKQLKNYVQFFWEGEWEANDKTDAVPIILFVCPGTSVLMYAKRSAKRLLAEEWDKDDQGRPNLQFTTIDKLRDKGLFGTIWEKA